MRARHWGAGRETATAVRQSRRRYISGARAATFLANVGRVGNFEERRAGRIKKIVPGSGEGLLPI